MAGKGAACKKCTNVFLRIDGTENPCPHCGNTEVVLLMFGTHD